MLIWAVSSAFLFFICSLSMIPIMAVAAYLVIFGCLLAGIALFALKRDKWAYRVAAGPAYAVAGILLVAFVVNVFIIVWI